MEWTHIVVGGGSSGCVLANRLSSVGRNKVLLIEAGADIAPGEEPPEILSPAPSVIFHGTRYLWPRLRVSPFGRDGRSRFYEQARVIGGGSTVNVQVANRGTPDDYDDWARLGAEGWDWNGVVPYFRKLERDLDYDGALHGAAGPIPISRIKRQSWPPFSQRLAQALEADGLSDIEDQNGCFSDGYFAIAYANEHNARVSAAMAYLPQSVRRRENLRIITNAFVTRLIVEGKVAVGVEYLEHGRRTVANGRTVVLCAGAIHTPGLLMRAGLGPAAHLRSLGIEVVRDLPGVGQNLLEHPGTHICAYVEPSFRLAPTMRKSGQVAFRFSSGQEGYERADLYVNTGATSAWHGVGRRLAYFYLWLNKSHSKGEITLRSSNPHDHPHVVLNLLQDERDVRRLAFGFRRLSRILRSPALNGVIHEPFPVRWSSLIRFVTQVNGRNAVAMSVIGSLIDSPAPIRRAVTKLILANAPSLDSLLSEPGRLEAYLQRSASSVWHPCGTCRMGSASDPMAVTDPQGRVHGTGGLRVADASLFPTIPRANTNVPVIMAAEKISDALITQTG